MPIFFKRYRKEMTGNDTWIIAAAYEGGKLKESIAFKEHDEVGVKLRNERAIDDFVEEADGEKKYVILLSDGPPKRIRGWMKTVAFTNPNVRWMEAAKKHYSTLYMSLWTLVELQEAAEMLGLKGLDGSRIRADTIKERYHTFGGVARECFPLTEDRVMAMQQDMIAEITQISSPEELADLIAEQHNHTVCHRVLHFAPEKGGVLTTTQLASRFVVAEVLGGGGECWKTEWTERVYLSLLKALRTAGWIELPRLECTNHQDETRGEANKLTSLRATSTRLPINFFNAGEKCVFTMQESLQEERKTSRVQLRYPVRRCGEMATATKGHWKIAAYILQV